MKDGIILSILCLSLSFGSSYSDSSNQYSKKVLYFGLSTGVVAVVAVTFGGLALKSLIDRGKFREEVEHLRSKIKNSNYDSDLKEKISMLESKILLCKKSMRNRVIGSIFSVFMALVFGYLTFVALNKSKSLVRNLEELLKSTKRESLERRLRKFVSYEELEKVAEAFNDSKKYCSKAKLAIENIVEGEFVYGGYEKDKRIFVEAYPFLKSTAAKLQTEEKKFKERLKDFMQKNQLTKEDIESIEDVDLRRYICVDYVAVMKEEFGDPILASLKILNEDAKHKQECSKFMAELTKTGKSKKSKKRNTASRKGARSKRKKVASKNLKGKKPTKVKKYPEGD